MRSFRYAVYVLLFFICVLTAGCSGEDAVQYEEVIGTGSDTYVQESDDELILDELVIDTMTLPICAYGTGETIGEADVTLVYNRDICQTADDGEYAAYLESAMFVRCDESLIDGLITVNEDEIFNWFYSGYARVYNIENRIEYTKDDGYRYEVLRYFHGMSGEALEAYGKEINEMYVSRREYMYLVRVSDNTWLCLDFRIPDGAAAVEDEAVYYDKAVARIEIPRIEYDIPALGEYLVHCISGHLTCDTYYVRTSEMQLEYIPGTEGYSEYPDIMRLYEWEPVATDNGYTVDRDKFSMFFGTDHISDYNICATDTACVMAVMAPDAPTVYFALPSDAAEEMTAIPHREYERRMDEYTERVDLMKSFLPDGAVRLTHMSQIFCMSDFLLVYESADEDLCIWRAEDIGERYEKLEIIIPEEYAYDRAEVTDISNGGGSGEYVILISLYNGESVRILEFVGAGRGGCMFNCELTEEDLEARKW